MEICGFTVMGYNGCKVMLTAVVVWFGLPVAIVLCYALFWVVVYLWLLFKKRK